MRGDHGDGVGGGGGWKGGKGWNERERGRDLNRACINYWLVDYGKSPRYRRLKGGDERKKG